MDLNNQKIKVLIELNDDLENYFRNTIIPQLFFDKDLILRKFTPAAMKQFSLFEDDIGLSIHYLINNLRYPSIIENINWVITTGKILEKEIQTTDSSWFQMNIIPFLKKIDNEPNGVIITFIDITNRISDLKEQEKIIADYETLLNKISHDIKNSLGNMLLSIEMMDLSDFEDKKEIKFYQETIGTGIKKINLILSELEDSKDQKNKYEAGDELLNIEDILDDVHIALINEISKSGASIIRQVDHSEIIFQRRHLRSIIYNLISNSIKFRSPDRNPEIFIKTTEDEKHIIISIKDNGIGIPPSNHEDVFSKFFRIEKSAEGSGVGLHLVKTLVKNAGGRIEIESELGVGSEFKVYLKSNVNLENNSSWE